MSIKGTLDAIIPFISAEKLISKTYTKWLHEWSISIDGGIGNFQKTILRRLWKKLKNNKARMFELQSLSWKLRLRVYFRLLISLNELAVKK